MMPDFNYWPINREHTPLLEAAYKIGARDGCEFYMPAEQHLLIKQALISTKDWEEDGDYCLTFERSNAQWELGKLLRPFWREVERVTPEYREYTWRIKVSTP